MHKILLVEDDETIRQQVKKIMEQWGFEVIAVDDFMDVLGTFVQTNPHLILMDIGLPLYNGYHWCQEIRKVSKVPIMFLSSRDQAMDIVMAINMGGDDYVTKPFDPNVLLAKIQGLLRRSYEFGTSRIKTFVFKFISVPAKWIKTSRRHVLNIYSDNNAYANLFKTDFG